MYLDNGEHWFYANSSSEAIALFEWQLKKLRQLIDEAITDPDDYLSLADQKAIVEQYNHEATKVSGWIDKLHKENSDCKWHFNGIRLYRLKS